MSRMVEVIDVTLSRLLRVWWAFTWRAVLMALGAFVVAWIVGSLVGAVLGIVLVVYGQNVLDWSTLLRILGGSIGLLIGIIFSVLTFKWILNKRIGDFRLALVSAEDIERPTALVSVGDPGDGVEKSLMQGDAV